MPPQKWELTNCMEFNNNRCNKMLINGYFSFDLATAVYAKSSENNLIQQHQNHLLTETYLKMPTNKQQNCHTNKDVTSNRD
jgi:hypothetical protein